MEVQYALKDNRDSGIGATLKNNKGSLSEFLGPGGHGDSNRAKIIVLFHGWKECLKKVNYQKRFILVHKLSKESHLVHFHGWKECLKHQGDGFVVNEIKVFFFFFFLQRQFKLTHPCP